MTCILVSREMKISSEEKLLSRNVSQHVIYTNAYEEEMKKTRIEMSEREESISSLEKDIAKRFVPSCTMLHSYPES